MEEDGDDLDNLFDGNESDDPQPQENANNENADHEGAVPEIVPVPKRVVKHPRLKFNPERLCGKRGIPILVDHFKDVKFKGKGHEKEDLKKLLTTLELWTHRLFPSMKFEGCLRQIEHLGKKRPVKTCLQKIRLDFPILDKDFVHNEDEEEQEQPNESEPDPPVQDAFDRLFDDYQERPRPIPNSQPSSSQTIGNVLGASFGASFSEEQKKRMEYNKMLAIERRKANLSAMQTINLGNSTGSEDTINVQSVLNSTPAERRVKFKNDPNFLFDYLKEQFTNTKSSSDSEKAKGKSGQSMQLKDRNVSGTEEVIESVEEGDKFVSTLEALPITRDNDRLDGEDKEELGLDELMDLVDEGDGDQTDRVALSCMQNDEGDKDKTDHGSLSCLKNSDEGNKDKTNHDALSNVRNNDCPESNGQEELELDELMDLVDEGDGDQTDHATLSCIKNNDDYDKDKTDQNDLSNVRNNDCPGGNSKEELDELMDLVDEDLPGETCDILPIKNTISSSDIEERPDSKEPEANVINCND